MTLHIAEPGAPGWEVYDMVRSGRGYRAEVAAGEPGELRYFIRAEANGTAGYRAQNGYDGGYLTVQVHRE